ncbi:MAG TPA: HlyD family type I secretion periplasmic adaptor subunit [Mariprofundaceae bacterium]|nr:HlyD family type I secretion periplasmic adaptor subunit [Mariprofundaceae bacterium]
MAAGENKKTRKRRLADVDPQDFMPGLLRVQNQPPTPFARAMLHMLLLLLFLLILWTAFGKLDVVATAEGKLIPQSYIKIVQPAEQGVIRDILVDDGQAVKAGQVLMRMDATVSDAEGKAIESDYQGRKIDLRRIDAELNDQPFERVSSEPEAPYNDALAQYQANRKAYQTALSEERSARDKAESDLATAREARTKLVQTLPHYREQAQSYADLAKDGYVSRFEAEDKERERIEKEQDLKAQEHIIASAKASLTQATRKLAQITADYRQKLQAERADVSDKLDKAEAEHTKQQYRHALLELKAPQDGIVKDLATHTAGTVISPGTILMTLVPKDENLRAEVWVSNEDVGFIHTGEPVKVKFASYQFQKYGMINGEVKELSADATDNTEPGRSQPQSGNRPGGKQPFAYRALIDLNAQHLIAEGIVHKLAPGMQVTAEIHLGSRTILEYLLSPVRGAFHDAARER